MIDIIYHCNGQSEWDNGNNFFRLLNFEKNISDLILFKRKILFDLNALTMS